MQKFFCCIFLVCVCVNSFSQNNASPYSIIGIGDIQQSYFDRSGGMGNTGISLSSTRYMFHANPASYAKLDDHYFSMELAARYKSITYSGTGVSITNNKSSDISIEKLAFAHKLKNWWAVSIGLMPYSTSNYNFSGKKNVQGTNISTDADYEGTGGLNQVYIANAFNVAKNFRAGLQTTVLFGNFTQKEILYTDALGITNSPITTTSKIYMSKILLKGGLQYDAKLNKNWVLSLGAVASQKTTFNATYDISVSNETGTLDSTETYKSNYFTLPAIYGTGIAFTNKNKLTFTADYQRQLWSDLNYKGFNYQLVNSDRISAGFEYSKKVPYLGAIIETYYLQTGVYYSNSYLKTYNQQLNDYGISFGAGFNSKRSQFGYQLNLQIGKRGTTANNLIKENYMQAGVTLTYRDFWFTNVKRFND